MKLGLFGGTFDPPHIGHLIVAQDAYTGLALDRVIFVPARIPPHKRSQTITPASLRLEMLAAAIAGNPAFAIDDLELKREGPSYTVDTLRAFRERAPHDWLFLLMGADQYGDLATWHEAAEIPRLAQVVVLARRGDAPARNATLVDVTRIDTSGTEIRRRIARGQSIRYLVPDAVETIIRREGLYLPASP